MKTKTLKTVRKCLVFALAIALAFTAFACKNKGNPDPSPADPSGTSGGTENAYVFDADAKAVTGKTILPSAEPDFSGVTEKMNVTSWDAPDPTEQQMSYYKDTGFNTAILFPWAGYDPATTAGRQKIREALSYYDEVGGIRAYIHLGNGWQQRGNGQQLGGATDPTYFWKSINEKLRGAGAVDFTEYDCFQGIMVFDEPGGDYGTKYTYKDRDFLVEQWQQFKDLWNADGPFKNGSYGDYEFHINMSHDSCFDIMEEIFPMVLGDGGKMIASLDYYPLEYDVTNHVPTIRDILSGTYGYDHLATLAGQYDLHMEVFLQTGQLNPIAGDARGDDADGYLSVADMRWQTYTAAAFGARGISYFVYYETQNESGSGLYPGVVSNVGRNPTKAYNYVKEANEEFQKMYPVFASFDWKGVTTQPGSRNLAKNSGYYNTNFDSISRNKVGSHSRITDFTSTRDTLIGIFENDDYEGFLVQNFEDPYFKRDDVISVTFKGATRAVIYDKGEKSVVNLDGGRLDYTIEYGDGIFVIPLA